MVDSPRVARDEKKRKEVAEAQLRCPKGCKIVFYLNGFKRVRCADGKVRQPQKLELKCASCDNNFKFSERGYASCKSTCDYFLCDKCAICKNCDSLLVKKNKAHRDYNYSGSTHWSYCRRCDGHFNYKDEPKEK